jgi:hypothetical protein
MGAATAVQDASPGHIFTMAEHTCIGLSMGIAESSRDCLHLACGESRQQGVRSKSMRMLVCSAKTAHTQAYGMSYDDMMV